LKNKKIRQAVILAGGFGKRLGQITKSLAKPMIKFNDKPFLYYLIEELKKNKIEKILILAGFKGKYIKNKLKKFKNTKVIIEKKPLGTLGSVITSSKHCEDRFLLINGDTLFNIIYLNKIIEYEKFKTFLFLTKNSNYKSNNLLNNIDIRSKKIYFTKTKKKMYAGISILSKENFKGFLKNKFYSFEKDYVPNLIKKNLLYGNYDESYFIDFGIKKNLVFLKQNFKKLTEKKCVFFDRDNTLILDKGYTYKSSDLIWNKGAIKAIKYLNKLNYLVIVVTNQSGIARGYYKEQDVLKFHNYMNKDLYKHGACINDFFYCPFYEKGKIKRYKKKSIDRKPNNGMILKSLKKWNINKKKSFFIGDSNTDELAAKKSQIKFLKFKKRNDLYKLVKRNIT